MEKKNVNEQLLDKVYGGAMEFPHPEGKKEMVQYCPLCKVGILKTTEYSEPGRKGRSFVTKCTGDASKGVEPCSYYDTGWHL